MANVLVKGSREQSLVQVKPHRWALSFWARDFRRLARPWVVRRHVRRFCQPLELSGNENFSRLSTPAVIIANHTSHFDTLIVLSVLPTRLYDWVAIAAAADRFYTEKLKGAWYSLRYNAFPITRNGGRAALEYSEWLLQQGQSLLMFPEGTRSKTGELLPFHPGPAILALRQGVPVLPISIGGAAHILRPGTRRARPAPVSVEVGTPLSFEGIDSVSDATAEMEAAMRALGDRHISRDVAPPVLSASR
jgi:1-acyl-sn-glycerol-3-phosphate acyltransferase